MNKMKSILLTVCCLCSLQAMASEPVSGLQQYREKVLQYNQDLKSAELNIARQKELLKSAKADFLPALSANGNFNYTGNPRQLDLHLPEWEPLHLQGRETSYGASVSVSQPIYQGGRLKAGYDKAKQEQRIALFEQQQLKNELLYRADVCYWNAIASRELVDVSRQYQSSVGKLVAIVQERVEAEFTDRNDLLMAEVKKNEADYQLLQAIHDADVSFLSMSVLAGLSADSVFELDSLVTPVREATVHTGFHPENSNRAELRIATENIARQQSLKKLENSQFLPHLSVGVDGSYAAPGYDFTADMDWNYAIYAKLSIPLYEWGKRKNVRRAGNYQVRMAKENYSKVVDQVYLETETAGCAYRQAVEQVLLTEKSLEKAAESESISLDNYREGRISIVEVINAQLYHLQARVNYIQSKLKAQVSRSDYYRAVGMSF